MRRQGFSLLAVLWVVGCGRSQTRAAATDSANGVSESVAPAAPAPAPVAPAPAAETSPREKRPAVTKAPKTIEAVLAEHSDSLMAVPGVLGTAVGRCSGAPCIRVLVGRVTDEVRRRVPHTLEGYPVHIDVTGPIVPR